MLKPGIDAISHRLLRRNMLQLGILGGGIYSPSCASVPVYAGPETGSGGGESAEKTAARNCILIWLDGGPSHLETWDMKPNASAEVRGPLTAISTSVPGIQISECLAETSRRMEHMAIIRSMTSPLGEHNLGTHYLMTGYQPTPALEYPVFSSAANFLRQQNASTLAVRKSGTLPDNVAIPDFAVGGAKLAGHGYLPPPTAPFSVGSDPASSAFQVRDLQMSEAIDLARLERRQQFMNHMKSLDSILPSNQAEAVSSFEQAFHVLTSQQAQRAFDLSDEPDEIRRKYGPKSIGQSCLLARRLVEHGVPFVTVNFRGWDTHANIYTALKEGYTGAKNSVGLIPSLDLALSSLLDDLNERGLLEQTLVIVMGEFGRTPKLNAAGGRDHWPRAFSVALAGGGIRGGQIIGASDRTGESPADRPVTPADLVCTIYTLLGFDPQAELHTHDGRPVRLVPHTAKPVSELLT